MQHSYLKFNLVGPILSALLLTNVQLMAQGLFQTIRGSVVDKINKQPLIGATVELGTVAVVSDLDGQFLLESIPVGRYKIVCRYLGYATQILDDVLVNSIKEVVLDFQLEETPFQAGEVIILASKHPHEPLNALSMVSTRAFSSEETQRYPASANDPGRMAVGFPGVKPARDNRNDLVIRGNPPFGLLWRVEGVDIPNPNHFARIGSSGGGITIFSISMLDHSDFSSGGFAANYGNAISGVFDINFRKGNMENREHTFRAGMLGLDFSTEGPIRKGSSSYLVNYRYSTLGILDALDIHLVDERESNTFQDLSFKTSFKSRNKKHNLSIWGMGGLSKEFEDVVSGIENWKTYSDYYTRKFDTDMGVIGLNYQYLIDDKSYLKLSLAAMGQQIIWRNDTLNQNLIPTAVNDEIYNNDKLTLNSTYTRKLSPALTLQSGVLASQLIYNLKRIKYLPRTRQLLNEDGHSFLFQHFANLAINPNSRWKLNLGIHSIHFSLNNTGSIEPRLGTEYYFSENCSIALGYGKYSVFLPIGHYLARITTELGVIEQPNLSLSPIISHQLITTLNYHFTNYKLKIEPYYQKLKNIPVDQDIRSTYSLINEIDGYSSQALTGKGSATNIGVDLTLEKYFTNQGFFIFSTSLSDSKYTSLDGTSHNTRFNSNFFSSFMGAKEINLNSHSILQIGTRILYGLGGYVSPILSLDRNPSDPSLPLLDESQPFTERVKSYFRPDIRISLRNDSSHSSWSLSLDIQNVASIKNIDVIDRTFDPKRIKWGFRDQAGMVPILSFQIDFS